MAVGSIDGLEEHHLNEFVAQCSLDFEAWSRLISSVEQMFPEDLDKISLVYDSFLSEFPLCYVYWKKYAEHNARLSDVENVVRIFERAVESVPYSVGVWVDYCSFSVSSFEDPLDVCRLFERGLSFVGKDYLCHTLWDKYIEYEYSQEQWNSLANIYIQTLKFPTKKLHQYYDNFKKLVSIWKEMVFQGSSQVEVRSKQETNGGIMELEDVEISHVVNDMLDPSTRSVALQKYISIGECFYRKACDLDGKLQKFEQSICRPYFHVKPLDDNQLHNWHRYLDHVEMEGDFDWAVKLYERCLISCANYPEFWMRYVDYVESKGGREIAIDALERATCIFLKNAPEIHLFNAWFKEKKGDVDGAHAAFQPCDQDFGSYFIDTVRRKANMERRMGNFASASNVYKEALDLAAEKRPDALPMLYVHFAHLRYMITNSAEATREVLLNGIQRVPQSKVLLEELVRFTLMHDGAKQVDLLDSVMAKALAPWSDDSGGFSAKDREDLSRLYLEFIDSYGSIHDITRAWNRHLKLFPHLVRVQSSLKKPAKVGAVWKMVFEGRSDSLNTHPETSQGECNGNRLIQLPLLEEKLLVAENKDKSEQAIHGQTLFEDGNGSVSDLQLVPSEVKKTLVKYECRANESGSGILHQAADDRNPAEVGKGSKSRSIQEKQEREKGQRSQQKKPQQNDESHIIIVSPSPGLEATREASVSNESTPAGNHSVDKVPSISSPRRSRDDNAADACNESPSPSPRLRHRDPQRASSHDRPSDREGNQRQRNSSDKGRSDHGSPVNSGERLERSLSPRRRSSHGYLDDRRHRERSLSPRRHNSRWHTEERWHRDRRQRRYFRPQDNSRGHRDGRMQNQNIVVIGNKGKMQYAQRQAGGSASQTQLPAEPISYPQAQTNRYPLPTNEQFTNAQSNQLYNQMWQYYYYNQQPQQLLQPPPAGLQQQVQQMPPHQQLQQQMQNPVEQQGQQHMQTPQPQQTQTHQQQLLHLQYQQQQLYQQPQFQQQHQQQQTNEKPESQQQQLQLQQQMQLLQQQLYLQQQQPPPQQQQVQIQQQQQPQLQQKDEGQQQQQSSYQYQLQQQQYLLYLQQLHQYQQSQQQPGLDQRSFQQQHELPENQTQQDKLPEIQNRNEKSQPQPNEGTSQVDSLSSHHQQGQGIEPPRSTTSGVAALPQPSQDEVPELEGTDM